jgi:CheY-like chemotaxis protein
MSPPAESLTILVVDDQASSRVAIAAMLDNLGHRVVEADTAAWAMTMFARHTPDLVLLDVEMPDASGYEVARQLRAAEPGGWTPIVFLSGLDQDIDLWRGIEARG